MLTSSFGNSLEIMKIQRGCKGHKEDCSCGRPLRGRLATGALTQAPGLRFLLASMATSLQLTRQAAALLRQTRGDSGAVPAGCFIQTLLLL